MSRRDEIEQLIRDSAGLIHEHEQTVQVGEPEEKLRAQRAIQVQWEHIEHYLDEYRQIVPVSDWPADIVQVSAHFGAPPTSPEPVPFPPSRPATSEPKTLLILSTSSRDVHEFEQCLQQARIRDRFIVQVARVVRPHDLHQALLHYKPHFVHLAGYTKEPGLALEDECRNAFPVEPEALSSLFSLFAGQVECVILDTCYRAEQAEAISRHIDHVIGIGKEIENAVAIAFVTGFYDALSDGLSVEEAFKHGHSRMNLTCKPLSPRPVLYRRIDQELGRLLAEMCRQAADKLGVQNASAWLIDRDGKLRIKAGIGYFEQPLSQNASYDVGKGVTGWVALGNTFRGTMGDIRRHRFFEGVFLDPSFKEETEEPATLLMLPIYSPRMEGRPIGIIKVEGTRRDRNDIFGRQDERDLKALVESRASDIETRITYDIPFPPSLPAPVKHNLQEKRIIPTFVGRERQIQDCLDLLVEGRRPIVTIFGDAGVGKTTLAVKLAWSLIDQATFDAVYFIDLVAVNDAGGLIDKLTSALGIMLKPAPDGQADIIAQAIQKLRNELSRSETLLILDNFEGLVGNEPSTALLDALVAIPKLRILVTSRPLLGSIPWEEPYELQPLMPDQAEALFMDLSRTKVYTDKDKQSVCEICRLVHNIPLAIELVSRHTEMGLRNLIAHLKRDQLSMLKISGRPKIDRHFTDMSLSIDLSYNHLSEQEKRALLGVSVFRTSFTSESAAAITTLQDPFLCLQALCNWRLLKQAGVRYYLLETVKSFAQTRLDQEGSTMGLDRDKLYEKLLDHYLEFLQECHDSLHRVEMEYENIEGLLEWIAEQTDPRSRARRFLARFCFYLAEYWRIRCKWKTVQVYVKTALETARVDNDRLTQARLLNVLGQLGTELGIVSEPLEAFQEALALVGTLLVQASQDREVPETKALLLRELGRWVDNIVYKLGKTPVLKEYAHLSPPEHYFEQSLSLWQALGDEYQEARLLQNLGFRAMVNDDLQNAVSLQRRALDIARKVGNLELEGRCLHQMGRIAIQLFDQMRSGSLIAQDQVSQIRAQLDEKVPQDDRDSDLHRAAALLNRACEIAVEMEDRRAESRTRREIGALKMALADQSESLASRKALLDQAEEELKRALEIAQSTGERAGVEKIDPQLDRLKEVRRMLDAN